MDVRQNLASTVAGLEELVNRAQRLTNQNLADVAKMALGRVRQLADHPDLDRVHDDANDAPPPNKAEAIERMRVEGDKNPEDAAKKKWPHLFEPLPFDPNATNRTDVGQEANRGQPNADKPKDTFRPGDPKFDPANPNFQNPNNANLNPDGTLRQAPNAVGAQPDVRPAS